MKLRELPEGTYDEYVFTEYKTICFLKGKKTTKRWKRDEILAVGVARFHPKDDPNTYDDGKGIVISSGRAVKMFEKHYPVVFTAPSWTTYGGHTVTTLSGSSGTVTLK